MMKFKFFLLLPALLFLTNCAGVNVDRLNAAYATGSSFTANLTKEYRDFANEEAKEYDWSQAGHFAEKGLKASRGENVPPENPKDWSLPKSKVAEFNNYHHRLNGMLDGGARKASPQLAAKTQAMFDCWLEQQQENWQEDDIDACRGEFLKAFGALEKKTPDLAGKLKKQASLRNIPDKIPDSTPGVVYFSHNHAVLNRSGLKIVKDAAAAIKKRGYVTVIGHTDTTGTDDYNMRLSDRRAAAVRDALIAQGVYAKMIKLKAMGEKDLAVPTADGVREPKNRRAQILIE